MGDAHLDYSIYNREERDICAHLFRLLLEDQPNWGPLCQFLGVEAVTNPRVYCEVALIRDAYHARKPDSGEFMSELVELVARQENVDNHTPFPKLPDAIKNPGRTHPKQIRFKLKDEWGELPESDDAVYGAVQGMFNAKPDLAICDGDTLYVYEAKFTEKFDLDQIHRTGMIAAVWSALLYTDLGFNSPPRISLRALGLEDKMPPAVRHEVEQFVTWGSIPEIAESVWAASDFSLQVLSKVKDL